MIKFKYILLPVFSFLSIKGFSQKDSTGIMDFLLGFPNEKFVFEKPDSSFILLEDSTGYFNKSNNSTIKYIVYPWQYSIVIQDIRKPKNVEEGASFVDTFIVKSKIPEREFFIYIFKQTLPPEIQSEAQYGFMAITAFKNYTLCIIGVYSESEEKVLKNKFIRSALSVKEKE